MSEPIECYICALGPEDNSESAVYEIEGPRKTVHCCTEHYSSIVWASIGDGYPKIRLNEPASR